MTGHTIETVKALETWQLVDFINRANSEYRAGTPIISDDKYDHVYIAELRIRSPNHELLKKVEEEPDFGEGKVRHPVPMLSTEKAYEAAEVLAWAKKCLKAANEIGIPPLLVNFRCTPKLDGMAAKFYAKIGRLATRGNGLTGNDVTSCLDKGVVTGSLELDCAGEIVMKKSYFDKRLKDDFKHPRNVVVGAVSADTLDEKVAKALKDGAVEFMPFYQLDFWKGDAKALISGLNRIYESVTDCDYPVDGMVIEVTDKKLQEHMGATSHHNRWQIAKKTRGEMHKCLVTDINWQVGRTGKITPVINIEPTKIAGAVVSNVTGHHAGNVKQQQIGKGSLIEVTRSGEVIPFMSRVLKSSSAELPSHCPSCETELHWEGDFLMCGGEYCGSKAKAKLLHFFKTIESVDGIGPKVAELLVAAGYTKPSEIIPMSHHKMIGAGISEGVARNIMISITAALKSPLEDWRLLAAFGIHTLGRGSGRKLLTEMTIEELLSRDVDVERLVKVEGIGCVAAESICEGKNRLKDEIQAVLNFGWNLEVTSEQTAVDSPIAGKTFVFTGSMLSGSRSDMEKQVIALGGKASKSVSKRTDYVVAGEKAGSKLTKAQGLGVTVLTEEQYLEMVA